MKSDKLKIFRGSFFSLTLFSLAEKVIAYIYQATMAAVLGAGALTDCYSAASQLFDLIDSTILSAMVIATLRKYNEVRSSGEDRGQSLLANVNSCLAIIMFAFSILVLIFSRPISYVIAPGFSADIRDNLVLCIRIMCVIPTIMAFTTVKQVLLRHNRHFIVVNSRSLCISVSGLVVLAIASLVNPQTSALLCIGYVVSSLLFLFVLGISSKRFETISLVKPKINADIKSLLKLAVPTIMSSGIVRVSLMIDQIIASSSINGSVSCLYYSQQLYHIVSGFLIVNLSMIILTDFMKLAVNNSYAEIILRMRKAISSILLLLLPVTIITLVFSKEIVIIAFQRGAFGQEATLQVSTLLFFYAIGFVAELFNTVFTQVLYSFGKTKTAMINSLIAMSINIVTSIVLTRIIGIAGIAIGTSISQICEIPFSRSAVKKCVPSYKSSVGLQYTSKLIISAIVGTVAVLLIKTLQLGAMLSFILATLLMFFVFWSMLLLLKEETAKGYFNSFVNTLKKK